MMIKRLTAAWKKWWILILMVVLGLGLRYLVTSIPEPSHVTANLRSYELFQAWQVDTLMESVSELRPVIGLRGIASLIPLALQFTGWGGLLVWVGLHATRLLLFWDIARRLGGKTAGLLGLGLLVIFPPDVLISHGIQIAAIQATLVVFTLWLGLVFPQKKFLRIAWLAGWLGLALAAYIYMEPFWFLPLLVLLPALRILLARKLETRLGVGKVSLTLGTLLNAVLPLAWWTWVLVVAFSPEGFSANSAIFTFFTPPASDLAANSLWVTRMGLPLLLALSGLTWTFIIKEKLSEAMQSFLPLLGGLLLFTALSLADPLIILLPLLLLVIGFFCTQLAAVDWRRLLTWGGLTVTVAALVYFILPNSLAPALRLHQGEHHFLWGFIGFFNRARADQLYELGTGLLFAFLLLGILLSLRNPDKHRSHVWQVGLVLLALVWLHDIQAVHVQTSLELRGLQDAVKDLLYDVESLEATGNPVPPLYISESSLPTLIALGGADIFDNLPLEVHTFTDLAQVPDQAYILFTAPDYYDLPEDTWHLNASDFTPVVQGRNLDQSTFLYRRYSEFPVDKPDWKTLVHHSQPDLDMGAFINAGEQCQALQRWVSTSTRDPYFEIDSSYVYCFESHEDLFTFRPLQFYSLPGDGLEISLSEGIYQISRYSHDSPLWGPETLFKDVELQPGLYRLRLKIASQGSISPLYWLVNGQEHVYARGVSLPEPVIIDLLIRVNAPTTLTAAPFLFDDLRASASIFDFQLEAVTLKEINGE